MHPAEISFTSRYVYCTSNQNMNTPIIKMKMWMMGDSELFWEQYHLTVLKWAYLNIGWSFICTSNKAKLFCYERGLSRPAWCSLNCYCHLCSKYLPACGAFALKMYYLDRDIQTLRLRLKLFCFVFQVIISALRWGWKNSTLSDCSFYDLCGSQHMQTCVCGIKHLSFVACWITFCW